MGTVGLYSPRTKMIMTLILFWTTFVLRKAKLGLQLARQWMILAWMRFEPGSPQLWTVRTNWSETQALLSGDTMYIMHDILLLYVWQLHHLNYFKRFKIVLYIIFNENLFADFLSIFREYWLKSGDVLSRKFPNFGRPFGFLSIRVI